MGKRANGEHSIYQRKDGRWCAAIVCDDSVTGQRSRTVLYGKTRTEVRNKLRGEWVGHCIPSIAGNLSAPENCWMTSTASLRARATSAAVPADTARLA